jgi:hypothetical protein
MSTRRMSQQELDEARCRFRQKQKKRKDLEAQLAELEKQLGGVSDAQLEKLFPELVMLPTSSATEFIRERLNKVPHDDPQRDSKWKLAIIDLVASDVPLDPGTRSKIAAELRRLYFPNSGHKRAKRQAEFVNIEHYKQHLRDCGLTAAAADREIAASLGFKTVGALRKHVLRAFSKTKN